MKTNQGRGDHSRGTPRNQSKTAVSALRTEVLENQARKGNYIPLCPSALFAFKEMIDDARGTPFEEATTRLEGILSLIRYNPEMHQEAKAIAMILDAEKILLNGPIMQRYQLEFPD